ncbi:hypothetical protein LSTR_LSTR003318 [Laodelphax striatellus]|uniref:AAA+ ATPase domain-containing protein n=1 Tax=Laodelphax striatellus TaxID=195883 RepID=A0A482X5K7_LAOST|nr:hypothetical protein LSTR_LSTR003318 [Laodelphax striatellus]
MGKITTPKSGQSGVVFSNGGRIKQSPFKPKILKRKSTYFADPFIVSRVEKYLEERSTDLEIDPDDLIEHLRTKYKEYGKKKFGPFAANVKKALNFIMEKHEVDAEFMQHQKGNKSSMGDEEDEEAEDFDVDEIDEEGEEEEDDDDLDVLEEEGEDGESDDSDLDGESTQNGGRKSFMNKTRMMSERIGNVVINNSGGMIKKFNETKSSSQELINISSDEEDKEPSPQKATQSLFQNGSVNIGNGYFVKNSASGPTTLTVVNKKDIESKIDAEKSKLQSGTAARTFVKQKFGSVYNNHDIKLKDVGGYSKVLKDVVELVVHLKHPKIYHFLGVNPPRGFLLHGPSGTGKTLLVRALSGELGIPMIKVAAPELVSGLSGGSEERIREVFLQGRTLAPCIIFLDEVDAITPRRDTTQKEMERRIVAQLITSLDELSDTPQGKEILVIGATNRPDAIDPALRRAGRFDREICLGIPDRAARRDILALLSKQLSLATDVSLDRLAMATPGYVGADLKALLTEAGIAAVTRIVDVKMKEVIELERAKEADAVKDVPMVEIKRVEGEESSSGEPAAKKLKTQDGSEKPATGEDALNTSVVEVDGCDATKSTQDVAGEEAISAEKASTSSSQANVGTKAVEKKVEQEDPNILNCKWQLSRQELMSLSIENRDFDVALKKVQPAAKREGFATVPDVTWDDVGSLQDIRRELKLAIMAPVQFPTAFASLGLTAASGVLLCGPPGCGKTLLAKAIANEAGINFISVKGPELLNMYVGESERAVRQCFVRARTSQPCVIFFDEIDALCPKRSDFGDGGRSARVVNQLLTEMDGVEDRSGVFLMAASNRPDILDPAVLRPGRIDKILYVGLPTAADRVDILRALTKNGTRPALAADVNLEEVGASDLCAGFTGADLSSLVREAGIESLKEFVEQACPPTTPAAAPQLTVAARHFAAALAKVKPSVSEMDQKRYAELKLKYSATPAEQNMEISE